MQSALYLDKGSSYEAEINAKMHLAWTHTTGFAAYSF